MTLALFHDAALENPIDENNPDEIREKVINESVEAEDIIYVASTNLLLYYENITLTMHEDNEDGVLIEYSEDAEPLNYVETLNLPDGDYSSPVPIHRKLSASTDKSIKRQDIKHNLNGDKYANNLTMLGMASWKQYYTLEEYYEVMVFLAVHGNLISRSKKWEW